MENFVMFTQTTPLLSIILIILALCLGIVFYLWSLQVFKKIELQIIKMKQNAENLEYLSQYIYETSYFILKEKRQTAKNDRNVAVEFLDKQAVLDELDEIKKQIQSIKRDHNLTNIESSQKVVDNAESHKKIYSNKTDNVLTQPLTPNEEAKFNNISGLIISYLKDLTEEKEHVCAQDLVYTMPNQYSLADIYQTLEIMKERKQVDWEDRSINPQSILKLL